MTSRASIVGGCEQVASSFMFLLRTIINGMRAHMRIKKSDRNVSWRTLERRGSREKKTAEQKRRRGDASSLDPMRMWWCFCSLRFQLCIEMRERGKKTSIACKTTREKVEGSTAFFLFSLVRNFFSSSSSSSLALFLFRSLLQGRMTFYYKYISRTVQLAFHFVYDATHWTSDGSRERERKEFT